MRVSGSIPTIWLDNEDGQGLERWVAHSARQMSFRKTSSRPFVPSHSLICGTVAVGERLHMTQRAVSE